MLDSLAIKPASWDLVGNEQDDNGRQIGEDGLPNYLTRIISSPLGWIDDETVKEQIWEAASVRLSERSGRTGKPQLHSYLLSHHVLER